MLSLIISLTTEAVQPDFRQSEWKKLSVSSIQSRYLVLYDRIIDKTTDVRLTMGEIKKDEHNSLFSEDSLWEPRFDNVYANVIYDGEERVYKCWYSPFIIDERTASIPPEKRNPYLTDYMDQRTRHREMAVCYVFIKDGISWKNLNLGLFEFIEKVIS